MAASDGDATGGNESGVEEHVPLNQRLRVLRITMLLTQEQLPEELRRIDRRVVLTVSGVYQWEAAPRKIRKVNLDAFIVLCWKRKAIVDAEQEVELRAEWVHAGKQRRQVTQEFVDLVERVRIRAHLSTTPTLPNPPGFSRSALERWRRERIRPQYRPFRAFMLYCRAENAFEGNEEQRLWTLWRAAGGEGQEEEHSSEEEVEGN